MRIVTRAVALVCVALIMAASDRPPESWRADGQPVTLRFAGIGPVAVAPFWRATASGGQCQLRLRTGRAPVQTLTTVGGPENGAPPCWSFVAVGRLKGPPGTARIGLIYLAGTSGARGRDAAVQTPVVIERPARAATWRVNTALGAELAADGATDLEAVRAHLALFTG